MRAAVLFTALFALAAPATARTHRRACKPKHQGAAIAFSSQDAQSTPTEAQTISIHSVIQLGVEPTPSSSAAETTIATDASTTDPSSDNTDTQSPTESTSNSEAPSSAQESSAAESTQAPESTQDSESTTTESSEPTATSADSTTAPVPTGDGLVWPSVSEGGATGPEYMAKEILDLHNVERAMFGAPPLEWDQSLAEFAAGHSDACVFQHSIAPPRTGGENIASAITPTMKSLFDMWAAEQSNYNWASPSTNGMDPSQQILHWTQIVWKGTQKLGCAWKSCPDGTVFSGYDSPSVFLVCEYFPAGNIVGGTEADTAEFFRTNVGPKV